MGAPQAGAPAGRPAWAKRGGERRCGEMRGDAWRSGQVRTCTGSVTGSMAVMTGAEKDAESSVATAAAGASAGDSPGAAATEAIAAGPCGAPGAQKGRCARSTATAHLCRRPVRPTRLYSPHLLHLYLRSQGEVHKTRGTHRRDPGEMNALIPPASPRRAEECEECEECASPCRQAASGEQDRWQQWLAMEVMVR